MLKMAPQKAGFRVAVITVSDSRHSGDKEDQSGQTLVQLIQNAWSISTLPVQIDLPGVHLPVGSAPGIASMASSYIWKMITSDDLESIQAAIKFFCDSENCSADVVITTGGTGFAERDVTPEATKSVLTKEAPGLVTAIINRSLQSTPFAALSRLAAGVRGRTLVVNFPGSVKAVKECWDVLKPLVPHAVDLLRGNAVKAESLHQQLGKEPIENLVKAPDEAVEERRHHCHHADDTLQSTVATNNASSRPRESPYPMIALEDATVCVLEQASTFSRRVCEIAVMDAMNRVLAEDIAAPDPQPPFPASIKDGYAVIVADGAGQRGVVPEAATAGVQLLPKLQPGWCVRISTGAPVPHAADAVVQVEDTTLIEEKDGEEIKIMINKAPTVGQDIRPVGSDVAQDEVVLAKGALLTSAEIGILASVGRTRVAVYDWPKVAVLSTGDELIDPLCSDGTFVPLPYGKIRDSNRPELIALLRHHGVDPKCIVDGGICIDEPSALLDALRKLLDQVDIVVTSGGVSMGERDYLKQILVNDLGFNLHFARVEMKPGKPTTFASNIWRTGSSSKPVLFFGLPGNPVSAWVTAILYVLPAIRKMAGYEKPQMAVMPVQLTSGYKLDPRPEFARAIFAGCPAGESTVPRALVVERNQMSSRMASNRQANLLLMLPARTTDKDTVRTGEIVQAMVIGAL